MENPKFANRLGYSDVEPYEVLGRVGQFGLRIRAMKAERKHEMADLDFHPGGFVGHYAKQRDQKWDIQPDPEAPELVVRLSRAKPRAGGRRPGFYYDRYGNRYQAAEQPRKFYDYNF